MATLIKQLIHKLGLRADPHVLEKTYELVRLLELRSVNVPLQVNEYGKIVLCADIVTSLMAIPIDKEQALKLSGLRTSHYVKNKRMIEKLLGLNDHHGVSDICKQLSLNNVDKKAEELLNLYHKVITSQQSVDIDFTHPQYAAMAVFMACKQCKRKVSKSQLLLFSNLKPSQWLHLEQKWDKFITRHYNDEMNTKLKDQNQASVASNDDSSQKNSMRRKLYTKIEDYEKWKKSMLVMAQGKLEKQLCHSDSLKTTTHCINLDFTDVVDDMILGC